MKVLRLSIVLTLVLFSTLFILRFFSRNQIFVDKKTISHYSFKKGTVRGLLLQYHIDYSSADIIHPDLDNHLRWGEQIEVVRVREVAEKEVDTVDFVLEWKRRTTQNLRRVEIQHGYRQKTHRLVRKVYHDDRVVESSRKDLKVEKFPVERLVFLDDNGIAEKVYDLSQAKKMTLVATAYWEGDPQSPGVITFSGHRVERGLVAVDPTVIPLGWRLYIPGYGYAYSSDTGSAIKGKRIDLFVESKKASRKWEYKKVTVYLLEKANKW